jgi:hypothetical protein
MPTRLPYRLTVLVPPDALALPAGTTVTTCVLRWLVVAHVLNTGEPPVRDMSARWYVDGSPLRDRAELTACLMPREQKNFDCRVDGAAIRAGLKTIVQFRTVGEDWWSAGADRSLVGGTSNDG